VTWRTTWTIALVACLVVTGFLILGHQSFRAAERAADAQIQSLFNRQLLVIGLAL
jgi:hypothetical protein